MCKKLLALIIILQYGVGAFANECESYFTANGVATIPYMSGERSYPVAQKLSEIYSERSGEDHIKYDQELTSVHAQREMTFQIKNPSTGLYDKFVDVPVNSRAVVLNSEQFDGLIQSTGPVLRKLRELLQLVYSGVKLNAKSLGLGHLSSDNQALVLDTIKSSIYLEPELIDERMKDYPFLAVSGFDGAIGDPDNPDPRFFEMNLGTPSGLSNNILLLDALLKMDEDFRNTVGPHLPKDDTFSILKETIESNAKAWTGVEGISVIVSPGVYNGAHADVAAISNLTGMPLVKPENLYMDQDGFIHLKNPSGYDPVVTGFYGRMEESFFMSSESVPMISPMNIEVNRKLSKELGLELREAAAYKYIRDEDGNIIDIERNENNEPVFDQVWTKLGESPNGDTAPMDIAEAIRSGKIYYSALGGRVVDDKRLFPIVSEYLVSETNKDKVARPVSTLDRSEYSKLYADPKSYVVKEPNNSGGVGVYFLLEMQETETKELLAKVKANPNEYEVQSIRNPNTLLKYEFDGKANVMAEEVATDIRIFPMMDAQGNVRAGPNSLLFRTGPSGSFFSNTSKGGGYGIVAVARGGEPGDDFEYKFYDYSVGHPIRRTVALDQAQNFTSFLNETLDMIEVLDREIDQEILQSQLKSLSFKFRDLMDLVPEEARYVASLFRYYADFPVLNWQKILELEQRLSRFMWDLHISQGELDPRIIAVSKDFFSKNLSRLDKYRNFGPTSINDFWVQDGAELRYLDQPEKFNYLVNVDGSITEKFDVAEVIHVPDPAIQKLIDEVREAGGQIRVAQEVLHDKSGANTYSNALGGFWVNHTIKDNSSYMIPVISYSPMATPNSVSAARKLAVLSHEVEHFRFWKETYDKYRAEGMSHDEATVRAYEYVDSEEMLVLNERRALNKEIEVEIEQSKKLKVNNLERPLHDTDFGIVNRLLYPEFEGMRRHLLNAIKVGGSEEELAKESQSAKELIRYQLLEAQKMKELAVHKLSGGDSTLKRLWAKYNKSELLKKWEDSPLVDLVLFPYGSEWLVNQKTFGLFSKLYLEVLEEENIEDNYNKSKAYELLKSPSINPVEVNDANPELEGQQQQQ